ncbi:hypothetical protein FACS189475_03850 [Betaproteobacteria bacterium]|nr:hypothetical protein FACS189475_03850 [Betaproteobacteria bacterium]
MTAIVGHGRYGLLRTFIRRKALRFSALRGLEELDVIGVIHHATRVGVLVIDAERMEKAESVIGH